MGKENTVKFKSRQFAIDIINLYKGLIENKKEYVLSKQVLRSGTSIGANIAEAEAGISKKDFLAKIYILPSKSVAKLSFGSTSCTKHNM